MLWKTPGLKRFCNWHYYSSSLQIWAIGRWNYRSVYETSSLNWPGAAILVCNPSLLSSFRLNLHKSAYKNEALQKPKKSKTKQKYQKIGFYLSVLVISCTLWVFWLGVRTFSFLFVSKLMHSLSPLAGVRKLLFYQFVYLCTLALVKLRVDAIARLVRTCRQKQNLQLRSMWLLHALNSSLHRPYLYCGQLNSGSWPKCDASLQQLCWKERKRHLLHMTLTDQNGRKDRKNWALELQRGIERTDVNLTTLIDNKVKKHCRKLF